MDTIQDKSLKIKKKSRNTKTGERNYICGGCNRAYKSYPALYLHIKRKHDGIRPPNTKASKPIGQVTKEKAHTGRPQKPLHDVDDISDREAYLEDIQSELLGLLGERLKAVSSMDSKPKLENVVVGILGITEDHCDDWMKQLKKKTEDLYAELKANNTDIRDIELDFEDFRGLDTNDPMKIIVWFMLWLGKYIVKANFIPDACMVFSKIWKVLHEKQFQIQDLDNKIVWTDVVKECDSHKDHLTYFDGNSDLVLDFVKKTCHLIGKTFE